MACSSGRRKAENLIKNHISRFPALLHTNRQFPYLNKTKGLVFACSRTSLGREDTQCSSTLAPRMLTDGHLASRKEIGRFFSQSRSNQEENPNTLISEILPQNKTTRN
jgi:hypothetical protein